MDIDMNNVLRLFLIILDYIGYLGPFILLATSIFFLKKKETLLTYYIFGYIINSIINIILKVFIKQPRPTEDINIFNASIAQGRRIGFDVYGMPSAHTQNVFYSTAFITFALKSPVISFVYLLVSMNTSWQRIKYKNHTLLQVICGAAVGLVTGYISYLFGMKNLIGLLKYKKDDDAPI